VTVMCSERVPRSVLKLGSMGPKGASPIKSSTPPVKSKGKPAAPARGSSSGRLTDNRDDGVRSSREDLPAYMLDGPLPKTRDECFACLNFDDLPNRSVWEEAVTNMLREKFSKIVDVFIFYSKHGSECATIEAASRLKLGAQACTENDTQR